MHGRAHEHAAVIILEHWPFSDVNTHILTPTQDSEQIGIRHAEIIAQQKINKIAESIKPKDAVTKGIANMPAPTAVPVIIKVAPMDFNNMRIIF